MKLFILSLVSILSFAQIKSQFLYEFGDLVSASSFHLSSQGVIYVTDSGNNELISYDTLGNKIKDIGGFGWQNGLFDHPSDVFATPLSVYVADKNNHRIQYFDRSLNFVGSFSNRDEENYEYSFGFPLSVLLSNQGDMFILDGENSRIIKFDMSGNFLINFAGIDGGRFRIQKPFTFSIDLKGLIYASDDTVLNIYDSFGNGLYKIKFDEQIRSIRVIFDNCVIVTSASVKKLSLDNEKPLIQNIEISDIDFSSLRSALMLNNKLYLLLNNRIQVFDIER